MSDEGCPRPASPTTSATSTNLLDLPEEILLQILRHLSADNALDLLQGAAATCRLLRRLSRDQSIWLDVGMGLEGAADHGERESVLYDIACPRSDVKGDFVEEETAQLRRVFEKVGARLNSETRALRLKVTWRGQQNEFKARTMPRPRFQDVAEDVLRERCPNLFALRLTGLAPRFFGDYSIVSVHHLSYDVSPGDYNSGLFPMHASRCREEHLAMGVEGFRRLSMSQLRTLEVRDAIYPPCWSFSRQLSFILSPVHLHQVHYPPPDPHSFMVPSPHPALGVRKVVMRGFKALEITKGWDYFVEEEEEEEWRREAARGNIHQNLTVITENQRWKLRKRAPLKRLDKNTDAELLKYLRSWKSYYYNGKKE